MERHAHAALAHPVELRVDYALVLAALVGADNNVRGHELGVLREFCEALQLNAAQTDQVLAFVRAARADVVREICETLKTHELRYTLVSDLLYIAHSDASYDALEKELVVTIARLLGVSFRQLEGMDNYAQAVVAERVGRVPTDTTGDDTPDDTRANVIGALAAVVIPLFAVVAAGAGTGSFSIANGLERLGRGSFPAGFAVTAIIGAVAFYVVREVIRRVS